MRRNSSAVFFLILVFLMMSFPALANSPEIKNEEEKSTETSVAEKTSEVKPLSDTDAAEARKELENLAIAFGVKPASTATTDTTATTTTAGKQEHKTIGDVGDKALDMVGKAVASISATLEKVAPHVWKIMIRQQYAKAIAGLIVPWGLLLLIFLYWQIIRKAWKTEGIEDGSDDWWARLWIVRLIPGVVGFIISIWGFIRLSDSILLLINPEYYAVKDIITMLLGQVPQ